MNGKDLIAVVEYLNKGNSRTKNKHKKNTENSLVARLKSIEEEKTVLEAYLKEASQKGKPPGMKLTFSEGMLMAFMLQWFIFPLVTVFLKAHGMM